MSTNMRKDALAGNVRFSLSSAVAAVLMASLANAADEATAPRELPKVTAMATRVEETLDTVPATVSVIDSRQMQDQLVTDIKDLVRFEPGVAVRNSPARFTAAGSSTGRDGNSGFNIRGLEGNRVLMLVDGVRIADAYSFGAQSMGRGDYVDLDLLKSVEILRGPASALYGSDGVAGAVSFTTKDPEDLLSVNKNRATRTSVAYASADRSLSEGLTAAGRAGAWTAMLAYTRRDAHEQQTQGDNDGASINRTAAIPQDIASNAMLGKLVFTPNQTHRLRMTLDHLDRRTDSNVLSALGGNTLALSARDDIKRDRISIDHRYLGKQGAIESVNTTLYYQNSRTREYSAEDRNTSADRTRDNTFDNRVVGLGSQASSSVTWGGIDHHLVYGIDASQTRQQGVRDGTVPTPPDVFPTHAFPVTDSTLAGGYVQDELLLNERLRLYPALRYDYYSIDPTNDALFTASIPKSQHDTHLTPKLAATMQINKVLGMFANYGAGYKAPTPSQVNVGFTNTAQFYRSIANPDLQPETSTTFEAGLRLRLDNASVDVTGFTGRYKNFIELSQVSGNFTPANPATYQYVNLNRATIKGIELKAAANLPAGLSTQVAASFAQGDYSGVDGLEKPLNSVEPWKLVAGLKWSNAAQRVGGQLIATHSAGKPGSRVDQTTCTSCYTPASFTVLDTTVWLNLTPQLTMRIGIFNLTDKKYWWWSDVRGVASTSAVLDAYTQPGRNVSASLSWKI